MEMRVIASCLFALHMLLFNFRLGAVSPFYSSFFIFIIFIWLLLICFRAMRISSGLSCQLDGLGHVWPHMSNSKAQYENNGTRSKLIYFSWPPLRQNVLAPLNKHTHHTQHTYSWPSREAWGAATTSSTRYRLVALMVGCRCFECEKSNEASDRHQTFLGK